MGSILDAAPAGFFESLSGEGASSTKVFHSLQLGHFPTQRGETYPHDWHTYFVCIFVTGGNDGVNWISWNADRKLLNQYSDVCNEIQQTSRFPR
jgi:hypothetical protein